jgi:hypothetical protein
MIAPARARARHPVMVDCCVALARYRSIELTARCSQVLVMILRRRYPRHVECHSQSATIWCSLARFYGHLLSDHQTRYESSPTERMVTDVCRVLVFACVLRKRDVHLGFLGRMALYVSKYTITWASMGRLARWQSMHGLISGLSSQCYRRSRDVPHYYRRRTAS